MKPVLLALTLFLAFSSDKDGCLLASETQTKARVLGTHILLEPDENKARFRIELADAESEKNQFCELEIADIKKQKLAPVSGVDLDYTIGFIKLGKNRMVVCLASVPEMSVKAQLVLFQKNQEGNWQKVMSQILFEHEVVVSPSLTYDDSGKSSSGPAIQVPLSISTFWPIGSDHEYPLKLTSDDTFHIKVDYFHKESNKTFTQMVDVTRPDKQ